MSWKDRVSFVLTDTLQIKKIAFLDLAFEGRDAPAKDEAFDADAALATGELGQLIPMLIDGLGGEHDFFASAPVISKPEPLAAPEAELATAPWD